MAKKCMMDKAAFEAEGHADQAKIRSLYEAGNKPQEQKTEWKMKVNGFAKETYSATLPESIGYMELPIEEAMPYFDWKMLHAIWGVRYGSPVPEVAELMQLRRDAEDELAVADFKIMLSARFFPASANKADEICFTADGKTHRWPMMRQEGDKNLSLCDFVVPESSGKKSAFGMFAICVHKRSKSHEHGCCCPACSNAYEDMIGKAVRMTLAEAASMWLDAAVESDSQWTPLAPVCAKHSHPLPEGGKMPIPSTCLSNEASITNLADNTSVIKIKKIKPAIGYSSCPDHTLKGEILEILDGSVMHKEGHCTCGCSHDHHHDHSHAGPLGIQLTESYAMTPEASICGLIFMHPEASYPQIRCISQKQYDRYVEHRGMNADTARRFLGHLLK
jgi:5-methyltetrahydrofolate--homocysteine methyltransferase